MIDALTQPDPLTFDAPRPAAQSAGDRPSAPVFAGLLDRAYSEGGTTEQQLREAAEKLVSTTFIMPMFEQLRSDPLAANLMHGGRAEKVFQQQLDQVLSDRISSATSFDLVDSVYKQLNADLTGKAVATHG